MERQHAAKKKSMFLVPSINRVLPQHMFLLLSFLLILATRQSRLSRPNRQLPTYLSLVHRYFFHHHARSESQDLSLVFPSKTTNSYFFLIGTTSHHNNTRYVYFILNPSPEPIEIQIDHHASFCPPHHRSLAVCGLWLPGIQLRRHES